MPEYFLISFAISPEDRVMLTLDIGPFLVPLEAFLHFMIASISLELDTILQNMLDYTNDDVEDTVGPVCSKNEELKDDCAILESLHIPRLLPTTIYRHPTFFAKIICQQPTR